MSLLVNKMGPYGSISAYFTLFFAITTSSYAEGSELLSSCEDSIKKRLKSPSSYSMVSTQTDTRASSPEAYAERYKSASARSVIIRVLNNSGEKIVDTTIFIEYEAVNSFGAKVHETAACRAIHKAGSDTSVDTINGIPAAVWAAGL